MFAYLATQKLFIFEYVGIIASFTSTTHEQAQVSNFLQVGLNVTGFLYGFFNCAAGKESSHQVLVKFQK